MQARFTLLALLAAVGILSGPPSASAAPTTSFVMYSDPDSWLGQNEHRFFSAPGTPFYVQTRGDVVEVMIWDETEHWTLQVAPPLGQELRAGVYAGAVEPSDRTGSHPGLIVYGDGRDDGGYGFFEVKDIAFAADGTVSRLWVVWVMQIRASPSTFGELRFNVPLPAGRLAADPTQVRWGPFDVGRVGVSVPVRIAPTGGGAQVTSVAVEGPHASFFPVQADSCSGHYVSGGEHCTVAVAFRSAEPGARTAALRVSESSGGSLTVPLEGYVYGGRTRIVLDSDPGDYIGQGQHYEYTQADSLLDVGAGRTGWGFHVDHPSDWWSGTFEVGAGDSLRPGATYTGAVRASSNGDAPGIDVIGNGRGCSEMTGEFTVHDLEVDEDGYSTEFAGSFVEHCEGAEPAFRGLVEFRRGNEVPPPPWGLPQMPADSPPIEPGEQPAPADGIPGDAPAPGTRRYQHRRCPGRTFARRHVITGTPRADRLAGGRRGELFRGGRGGDRLLGRPGADCIDGGRGNDVILGGRGSDMIVAGRGRDRIDCGPGRDLAYAGRRDRVRACERVIRKTR